MKREGLGNKLIRVFAIQVLLISVAMFAGIYITNTIVQTSLVREALDGEANHFWALYDLNPVRELPDTSNMRGYLAVGTDYSQVPEALRSYPPGHTRIDFEDGEPTLHVSDHAGARLFLVFASEQVSDLAFFFGIVPLSVALLVIYGLSFVTYRLSRRAISPIVRLASYFEDFDFNRDRVPALDLDPLRATADAEVASMIEAVEHFTASLGDFIERERIFTRDASHELRTPIAVFKGSLDLLDRDSSRPDSDKEALRRMRRTVEDMEGLIETLLLLAREDELQLPAEPIHANHLIAGYLDRLQPIAQKSRNTVRLHDVGDLRLHVPERVFQILVYNLVRNAINFTSNGAVDVTIEKQCLRVTDTGVGMDEHELESAFEPFFRSESGRAMSQGHGLGLSIVRRLARQFDWKITAQSNPNEGTSIEVRFAAPV